MGPEGVEPPTYCLEGSCSIQLSYDPAHSPFLLDAFQHIFFGTRAFEVPILCSNNVPKVILQSKHC